ncbi:hypothetical protein C3B58_11815 [Lactonifactor longoviformis]|uniref:Xylulokinase n=1 Tax=Lactonifactor longoviformis DSM 17459 TaxID=1122155 RepID=A0A1M5CH74_9CLOT|nr:FGGY-family carbohydrate kinase [Lactonifactor longoviformis]POP32472.1 hypothetical protein C3B58_11815 [Lactonifactor longoviformis]SHF54056.1 xylulokinase [Lactonifactor longoviformis DSM 17459]
MNILVLDIGTTSMRGVMYCEGKAVLKEVTCETPCIYKKEGIVEQDPNVWLNGVQRICRQIQEEFVIDAIAVTAFRSSVIAVDRAGTPLLPGIMWQDTRNSGICRELQGFSPMIRKKTGADLNTVFSGSRITWIKRNCPDIYRKTYKMVTVADFIIYHLTGRFATDYTYGSRSHLMNLHALIWDEELCRIFEIDSSKLCELIPPGSRAGYTTIGASKQFSIPHGIPVITSGGDQQCSAAGAGAWDKSTAVVNSGTGTFTVTVIDKVPEKEIESICNAASIPGKYILEANSLSGSAGFDWICRLLSGIGTQGRPDYKSINTLIEKVPPGAGGVSCIPHFSGCGTRAWNPQARAAFTGISLDTGRGELIRAVLEGIAVETKKNLKLLKGDGAAFDTIYISGGMTKSEVYNQLQANVYNCPVVSFKNPQATAFGAYMGAGVALAVFSDFKTAFQSGKWDDTRTIYEPKRETVALYEEIETRTELLFQYMRSMESSRRV